MASETEAVFEAWLAAVATPGYRLAAAMLRDPSDAEDVLQEAAVRAWRSFAHFDRDRPALPWFLAIVANCCRSSRRRRHDRDVELADSVPTTEDGSMSVAERLDLRQAILSLKPKDRLVVVLYYYFDYSLADVAEIAGMKLSTVKTRLYRSVRALRPAMNFKEGLE
jgi:RNA polymerase sigma-70 factor (ECF subfamily)